MVHHSYVVSLRLLSDHLLNREQRVKAEHDFSKWEYIETSVP